MDERHKANRGWDAHPSRQQSIAPRDFVLHDDLVFFLQDVMPKLDWSAFHQVFAGAMRGQPPFDVIRVVTLRTYADSVGVCSSREIAATCEWSLAFRAIVGAAAPDFRKIHGAALRLLFVEVLRLG